MSETIAPKPVLVIYLADYPPAENLAKLYAVVASWGYCPLMLPGNFENKVELLTLNEATDVVTITDLQNKVLLCMQNLEEEMKKGVDFKEETDKTSLDGFGTITWGSPD